MRRLLLTLGLASWPAIGLTQHLSVVEALCFDRFVPPILEKRFHIPVGCEIVDCCPGCPGGELVDIRVTIGGAVLGAVGLGLEGLSADRIKQVKVSGNGRVDGDRIVAQRGTTTISGIPAGTTSRIVVASFTPMVNQATLARLERVKTAPAQGRGNLDADGVGDEVTVSQFDGDFVVNSFLWRPRFHDCRKAWGPFPPTNDGLKVQGIADADNVVALIDSRIATGAAGCSDDQVARSTGETTFENMRAAAGCNSEIAIFAAANAMRFDSPVTTWTDNFGDVHTSLLENVIDMPVSVWIARNAAAEQAVDDVANALLLYSENKIGVRFTATFNNVSGNNEAVATIGTADDCSRVANVHASTFYTTNALNIYYVNGPFNGVNCARTTPGDGNINYIGTTSNLATLAHEIGHAFGLRPGNEGGHTNDVAGFGNDNIMSAGGPATRNRFTLGQAFRMNTHADIWGGTMLINNGLRPGPGRACPPLTTSTTCPALGRDWARP